MAAAPLISFVIFLAALSTGASTGPVVEPVYQEIRHDGNAKINFKFNTALTGCKIRVFEHDHIDTEIDLTQGSASPAVLLNSTSIFRTRMKVRYTGKGLEDGNCEVALTRVKYGSYLLKCRGTSTLGSAEGTSLLRSSFWQPMGSRTSTPRFVVATRGADVSALLTTHEALDWCGFWTPAAGRLFLDPGKSLPSDSRYRLHGAGIGSGQCGFTLTNVTEADAGVWDWYGFRGAYQAIKISVVATGAPPIGEPNLRALNELRLRAGDTLTATCGTSPSVPPANITWLLGGKVIRADAWNSTLDGDAARIALPWQPQPAYQTLSHVLTSSDNDTWLECRVSHVALSSPQTSRLKLQLLAGE